MLKNLNGKLITYIEGKHTKDEILKLLVDYLDKNTNSIEDKEIFYKEVLSREEIGSTGIGMGVAIPHARSSKIKDLVIMISVLEYPVDFNSIDGELIKVIALAGAPKDKSTEYLELLSYLSKVFRVSKNRLALKTVVNQKELMEAIMELEI